MGYYYQRIEVTDFGPYVTKVILCMSEEVTAEGIPADAFDVYVRVLDKAGTQVKLPKSFIERSEFVPSEGARTVLAAYPGDLEGKKLEKSRYLVLDLAYGPIYKASSALAADFTDISGHEIYTICDYTITQQKSFQGFEGLVFDRCAKVFNPQAERFTDSAASNGMRYGYFLPKLNGGRKPVVVWLHGAGEGGFDTPIAYSGNKVTELTEDWAQEKLGGGCIIFAPQCPTMWLDDGSHAYGDSGRSMYTEDLKACIDEFLSDYNDIVDRDRIYIGGDSNGGFMTMRMIMSYPGFFAAAFPICEAMIDSRVTDEDIRTMAAMPIWFTHAKNDPIVPPDRYVLPTYHRLMAAGAKNVHFTFWDKIVDLHAGFKNEKGEPWEYMGHFAWIPMLNDDCRTDFDGQPVTAEGREVTLIEWLGLQKRD